MKIYRLVPLLIALSNGLPGQSQYVGIAEGANWTNIRSTNFVSDNHYRNGIHGGLTYEYVTSTQISFAGKLTYTQRGFTNDIIFMDEMGNPTGGRAAIEYNYDYVSLPVSAGYVIGRTAFGFARIGLIPAFLVNAATKAPNFLSNGEINGTISYNITDRVTHVDLAGLGEIGGGYEIAERWRLSASCRYFRSITNAANSNYLSGSTIRHYGITAMAEVQYEL